MLGMRTFLRHVPTEVNVADGPSRGLFIGYHDAGDRKDLEKFDVIDPMTPDKVKDLLHPVSPSY